MVAVVLAREGSAAKTDAVGAEGVAARLLTAGSALEMEATEAGASASVVVVLAPGCWKKSLSAVVPCCILKYICEPSVDQDQAPQSGLAFRQQLPAGRWVQAGACRQGQCVGVL